MDLALKVVSGPLKNKIFRVKDGLTIGREGASIALDDPKVSSMHAQVRKMENDSWVVDSSVSKNGLRVKGEKETAVELAPGIIFFVGDSGFKVCTITPRKTDKPLKKQRYWNEILADFVADQAGFFKDQPKPLSPLDPALVLEFVRGTQANLKWILGFGPRKIGAASIDLPIWEPGAPAVCFEVLPSPDGLVFRTDHASVVRLNGEKVDTQVLRMGDTIHIMDTLIEVDFAE